MIAFLALQLARKAAPFFVLGLAGVVAALLVTVGVQTLALAGARTDLANARTAHEKALRVQAEGIAQQSEIMRADYEERVATDSRDRDKLTKELSDARAHESHLAADLRAGTRRVRGELCASHGVPGTASRAGMDGRGAVDGAGLAAAAIGAGDAADAKLRACVARVKADAKAVTRGRQ